MNDAYDWDDDWYAVTDDSLNAELQRELCPQHILHGIAATVIGRRQSRDDFLFLLQDGRLAQVHLTWRAETDPRWPAAQIFDSFESWKSVPPEDR